MLKPECQQCLRIVADPTRFKIFLFLKKHLSGVTVTRLVELTKLRQPTVTFHLNTMEKYGLIQKSRNGKEVLCKVKQNCQDCPLFSN